MHRVSNDVPIRALCPECVSCSLPDAAACRALDTRCPSLPESWWLRRSCIPYARASTRSLREDVVSSLQRLGLDTHFAAHSSSTLDMGQFMPAGGGEAAARAIARRFRLGVASAVGLAQPFPSHPVFSAGRYAPRNHAWASRTRRGRSPFSGILLVMFHASCPVSFALALRTIR